MRHGISVPVSPGDKFSSSARETNESESERLLSERSSPPQEPYVSSTHTGPDANRAFLLRAIALGCTMSLSIGGQYSSYVLGPLKSRLSRELGTDNTEFSLLISAFSLNSTWTPLVGGIIASRLGTTKTSILATGVIFIGQIFLLLGDLSEDVRLMALGMFIFGLGISPLSVVQETIIVRFFKSHGLGISLAIGLIAGKAAAFLSVATSFPLTQRFGSHAPFYVATFLSGFSVAVNLIYISASKWLVDGTGAALEASDIRFEARNRSAHSLSEAEALETVAAKHQVYFREVSHLGDVFWLYIALNALCGAIWAPFTHLAANIIEKRYGVAESTSTRQASYLLAGPVILYPLCGFLVDRLKPRPIALQLFTLSSCLTLLCYAWLALSPKWTGTALPGILSYAVGYGYAPFLLVVIVPQIVPLKFVPTALGAHKSLEQTGSTIFQTMAGWLLDTTKHGTNPFPSSSSGAIQHLLNIWIFLNVAHLVGVISLYWLYQNQNRALERVHRRRISQSASLLSDGGSVPPKLAIEGWEDAVGLQSAPNPSGASASLSYGTQGNVNHGSIADSAEQKKVQRGEISAMVCCALIIFAWIFFLGTVVLRLRSREERSGH